MIRLAEAGAAALAAAAMFVSGCATTEIAIDPDSEPGVEVQAFARTGKSRAGHRHVEVHGIAWNRDFVVGDEVLVLVDAVNTSRRAIGVPPSFPLEGRTLIDSGGVGFSRDPDADIGMQLDSIDICPPIADVIQPGERRRYRFTWTPRKDDVGEGFLILQLWPPFEKVEPLPITVRRS